MFGNYTTDRVTRIQTPTNQWGERQTPVESEKKARITRKNRIVRDATGSEVTSSSQLLTTFQPELTDTFRFDGIDHTVIAIHEKRAYGNAGWEIFLT